MSPVLCDAVFLLPSSSPHVPLLLMSLLIKVTQQKEGACHQHVVTLAWRCNCGRYLSLRQHTPRARWILLDGGGCKGGLAACLEVTRSEPYSGTQFTCFIHSSLIRTQHDLMYFISDLRLLFSKMEYSIISRPWKKKHCCPHR